MYIALKTDTSITSISLVDPKGHELKKEEWESGRQLSSQLLDHIQKLLQEHNTDWTHLQGVIAYRGPGSFTGLRIGISVANAITYAQGIPIVGASGKAWIADGASRLTAGQNDERVIPEYGGTANITRPGPHA